MEILSWNRLRWPASCLLFKSHENTGVLEHVPFHWGVNNVKISAVLLAVWIKGWFIVS